MEMVMTQGVSVVEASPVVEEKLPASSRGKRWGRVWTLGRVVPMVGHLFRRLVGSGNPDHRLETNIVAVRSKLRDHYPINDFDRFGCLRKADIAREIRAVSSEKYMGQSGIEDGLVDTFRVAGLPVAVASARGERPTMEDRHIAVELDLRSHGIKAPLFALFDGHGGDDVSQFMQDNFALALQEKLEELDRLSDLNLWNAFKMVFVEINEKWRLEGKNNYGGTTALVAIVINGVLWVANVGDSRAILSLEGEATQLTEEARPKEFRYFRGIVKRGGWVWVGRIAGHLAVARALGDFDVKGVTARPKLTKYDLTALKGKNNYLILGCDGLWMLPEQVR